MTTGGLVVENVTKFFGGVRAVDGCSFAVSPGTVVGLIGPNGAGKSTVFNLVSGLLTPNDGSISMDGTLLSGRTPVEIARMGIGRTFQTPRAFSKLDTLENVLASAVSTGERLHRALLGNYKEQERRNVKRCREVLQFVGLTEKAHEDSTRLSGGELRMLEVARQLVREPRILLLDEPTAGVDPAFQYRLAKLIRQLHEQGTTVVVVEHNLSFLLALAEHVIVLTQGKVLMEGSPDAVRRDARVREAYLGSNHVA